MASEITPIKKPRVEWVLALTLFAIGLVWLYRTPYNASGLEVPPDAVEYALAPLQLLETGHYDIILEGRPLPPRYPPWFSTILIAPAYLLLGHDPGNAIVPITVTAVLGVIFAWAIGRRVTGTSCGGIFAGLAILALPTYSSWASQVMSDVPATAGMLGGCLLYLDVIERPPSARRDFFAGLLVTVTFLFRPVFAAMALPFVFAFWQQRRGFLRRTVIFLIPLLGAAVATALYNRATFGSVGRNGYHFWTPVPSDYLELTFSFRNVATNLSIIGYTGFPILAAVAVVAWVIARMTGRKVALAASQKGLLQLIVFTVFTAAPIVVFHLFYFFPSRRFYLPLLAGTAILAGCLLALLVEQRWMRVLKLLMPAILILAIAYRVFTPEPAPVRRVVADRIRQHTPPNAVVISAVDPVYLERMAAAGSARRIVPLSRRVEYASKLLAPHRVDHPDPFPADWHDHRAAGLIRGGAVEAVRFVASEQIENLAAVAAAGTPLFLDATLLSPDDEEIIGQLRTRFEPTLRAPNLFELRPH